MASSLFVFLLVFLVSLFMFFILAAFNCCSWLSTMRLGLAWLILVLLAFIGLLLLVSSCWFLGLLLLTWFLLGLLGLSVVGLLDGRLECLLVVSLGFLASGSLHELLETFLLVFLIFLVIVVL